MAQLLTSFKGIGPTRSGTPLSRVASGKDVIAVFEVGNTSPIGTVLTQVTINPQTFAGTRLAQEASLWTRWRPERMEVIVTSSAGFMITGSYILGWTADANEAFVSGPNAVVRIGALVPSSTSFIGQMSRLIIPAGTVQRWLYTNTQEPDDSYHGKLVIALASQLGTIASGKVAMTVTLNWRVAFQGPRLIGAQTNQTIYAESDYSGYHTTSTSDWAAGAKLSLKQHAGGGLVPFPLARPQTVYKLDSQANLQYYKTSTELSKVHYGVLIPNFSTKALAVFEDKDKANKFATTGDSTHCLDYRAAGPVVEPDNPAWVEVIAMQQIRTQDEQTRRIIELEEEVRRLRLERAVDAEEVELSSASSFLELAP